jgi:hypothetical protein
VLWNVGLGQHLAAVSYPVPSLFNSRIFVVPQAA